LIALDDDGPILIDVLISMGGASLEAAAKSYESMLAVELMGDQLLPTHWSDLIEHPLVRSGWLGNLIDDSSQANSINETPNSAQTTKEAILAMVDIERDDLVSPSEFRAFLSRGLSRRSPLVIAEAGVQPGVDPSQSPWGPIDSDGNFLLDDQELTQAASNLIRLDANGDGIVTQQESTLAMTTEQSVGFMTSSSMLPQHSLAIVESTVPENADDLLRARRRLARNVAQFYTFLEAVPREQWTSWNDSQWSRLDRNQDARLDGDELLELTDIEAHVQIRLQIPGPLEAGAEASWQVTFPAGEPDLQSSQVTNGVRLRGKRLDTRCVYIDGFSHSVQNGLRQDLQRALTDDSYRELIVGQMDLRVGAVELLDTDGDKILSDEEFSNAWRWLNSRQGTRLLGRWSVVPFRWLQLADQNGDGRIIGMEADQVGTELRTLDADGNGQVSPDELQLMTTLELIRDDTRMDRYNKPTMSTTREAVDLDWFDAMDTNRDGFVSSSEFLGDSRHFDGLDLNKDGYASRSEVVGERASY
jgi:hypothetical protein